MLECNSYRGSSLAIREPHLQVHCIVQYALNASISNVQSVQNSLFPNLIFSTL